MPPSGSRTKRFRMGFRLCEPGRNQRQPFVLVHASRANQKPTAEGGSLGGEGAGSEHSTPWPPIGPAVSFLYPSSISRFDSRKEER